MCIHGADCTCAAFRSGHVSWPVLVRARGGSRVPAHRFGMGQPRVAVTARGGGPRKHPFAVFEFGRAARAGPLRPAEVPVGLRRRRSVRRSASSALVATGLWGAPHGRRACRVDHGDSARICRALMMKGALAPRRGAPWRRSRRFAGRWQRSVGVTVLPRSSPRRGGCSWHARPQSRQRSRLQGRACLQSSRSVRALRSA